MPPPKKALLRESAFKRLSEASVEVQELAEIWPEGWLLALPPNATILVAGAYRGRAMELLATMYGDFGRLIGFEPQLEHAEFTRERLKRFGSRVQVLDYGLGVTDGTFPMAEAGAEFAGFVNLDPAHARREGLLGTTVGELREFNLAMGQLGVRKIHCFLLNVEGYEFQLIPHLGATGWFDSGAISRLMAQIHWGMPGDSVFPQMAASLERTHKRVYDALPNWALWQWSGVEWD